MTHCPDREELELLINDLLTPPQSERVASHVDTCDLCRQTLDELTQAEDVRDSKVLPNEVPAFLKHLGKQHPSQFAADDDFRSYLDEPKSDEEIGRIGGFPVIEVIGSGSMGIVLRGRDEDLSRDVAIKILRPSLSAHPRYRERFLREARAMAAIDHPHVVPVHHVGSHEGLPFMVMKHLQGESLGSRLRRQGPMPEQQLRKLAVQIAQGLDAAHRSGTIHRDVKPENIWLEAPGDAVRLLDFGLVCPSDDSKITVDGVVIGTPAYMSPEQASGKADKRSDFYSLGAVLYEAASGKLPFPGDTVVEVLSSLGSTSPQDLHRHNSRLTSEFTGTVMQLLSKDAAKRPASSDALLRLTKPLDQATRTPSVTSLIAIACTALIALGVIVLQMRTPTGTIVVELADDVDPRAVKIEAASDGKVHVIDSLRGWDITVDEGRYRVSIIGGDDSLTLSNQSVAVTRNNKKHLRVYHRPNEDAPPAHRSGPAEPASPMMATETKDQPKQADIEIERSLARWVFSVGGSVQVIGQQDRLVKIREPGPAADAIVSLHTVDLQDCDIRDEDIDRIVTLGKVYRVYLGSNSKPSALTGDSLRRLSALKGGLSDLTLKNVNFDRSSLQHLTAFTALKNLHIKSPLTDDDLQSLATLRLKSLSISKSGLSGEGLKHLSALPLEALRLYDATLDGKAISDMPAWPKLETLVINAPPKSTITDQTLLSLRKYPGLKELSLAQLSSVSNDGLAVLRDLKQLQSLRLVVVPAVQDETLRMIAKDLPNLKALTLENTCENVTEAGFGALHSATHLQSITFGDSNPPSEAIIESLREALPDCTIQ